MERTFDLERLLRIAVLMAAVLAGSWVITSSLVPTDLAAQQDDLNCDECHTSDECLYCHDGEASPGIDRELEYDSQPICAFYPGVDPCARATRNTCSGLQVILQVLSGGFTDCIETVEIWYWT